MWFFFVFFVFSGTIHTPLIAACELEPGCPVVPPHSPHQGLFPSQLLFGQPRCHNLLDESSFLECLESPKNSEHSVSRDGRWSADRDNWR